jgi:hypothetical protein
MNLLIRVIVTLVIIGALLWGVGKLLVAFSVQEPFRTVCWVIVVVAAVITAAQMFGYGPSNWKNPPG